jgi:hypothetical protein
MTVGTVTFLRTALFTRTHAKPAIHVTNLAAATFHLISFAHGSNPPEKEGEAMTFRCNTFVSARLMFFAAFLLLFGAVASTSAQEKKVGQTNGVDNSKMGAYRALAQHIYGDFQKGDLAAAAEMGRVLERVWDKAEEYGGDTALAKTNRALFEEIDKAMDQFITPLMDAKGKPPDSAKVKAAFNFYLEKLKLAD